MSIERNVTDEVHDFRVAKALLWSLATKHGGLTDEQYQTWSRLSLELLDLIVLKGRRAFMPETTMEVCARWPGVPIPVLFGRTTDVGNIAWDATLSLIQLGSGVAFFDELFDWDQSGRPVFSRIKCRLRDRADGYDFILVELHLVEVNAPT